jgi:hypothetical protein
VLSIPVKTCHRSLIGHFHLIFLKMPPLKHSPLGQPFPLLPSVPNPSCCLLLVLGKEWTPTTPAPFQKKRVKK